MNSRHSGFIFKLHNKRVSFCNTREATAVLSHADDSVVLFRELSNGIVLSVRSCGWIDFDFDSDEITKSIGDCEDGDDFSAHLDKELKILKNRLIYMNVFLSCLYTSIESLHKINFQKQVVTSKDQVCHRGGKDVGFGGAAVSQEFLEGHEGRFQLPTWISIEALENSVDMFNQMIISADRKLVLPRFLGQSVKSVLS